MTEKKKPVNAPAVIIGDLGNSLLKVSVNNKEDSMEEIVIPHALVEISEAQFKTFSQPFADSDVGRPDYFMLDDHYYIVGTMAERYGQIVRRSGASKYTRDYYGVLFSACLLRLFPQGHDNLYVFVCHPPSDIPYRNEQMKSVYGTFNVKTSGKNTLTYEVRFVNTYAEPLGGYMNAMLNTKGELKTKNGIQDGRVLIFDIGGRISSLVPAENVGNIEYNMARSIHSGILNVIEVFEQELRKKYYDDFKQTNIIPSDRLRDALRTGVYHGAGRELIVTDIANFSKNVLLNQLRTVYFNDAGGPQAYDHILITGGGGGAMYVRMREELLDHDSVWLADENPDLLHLANMRGGGKMWKMLANEGAFPKVL